MLQVQALYNYFCKNHFLSELVMTKIMAFPFDKGNLSMCIVSFNFIDSRKWSFFKQKLNFLPTFSYGKIFHISKWKILCHFCFFIFVLTRKFMIATFIFLILSQKSTSIYRTFRVKMSFQTKGQRF